MNSTVDRVKFTVGRKKSFFRSFQLKRLALTSLVCFLITLLNPRSVAAQLLHLPISSFLPALTIPATGAIANLSDEVSLQARQMSIRILGAENAGSGVLIRRQGQHYVAVTNAHVLEDGINERYTVLTADGRSYQATRLYKSINDQDLALVLFPSDRSYPTAQLRDLRDLQIGETVYAAGFPNWSVINPTHLQSTKEQGVHAFHLAIGQVSMLLSHPFKQGYQLGYTNDVEPGMSGGALLDRQGRLIGINGVLKSPPQGIAAFALADGTLPPESLFQAMNSLSWAIPGFTIQAFLETQSITIPIPSISEIQY